MKRGIRYFAMIFIVGAWSLSFNARAVDLSSYFNIIDGRTLAYNLYEFTGGSWISSGSEVTVVTSFGGGVRGEVYLQLPSLTLDSMDIWLEQLDGQYLLGEYDFLISELVQFVDPPGPLDGVKNLGETVTFTFQRLENGVPAGTLQVDETLVAENFTYTTIDGTQTFTDCVVVLIEVAFDGVPDEIAYWIWANNIGPVAEYITAPDGTPVEFREILAVF